MRAALILAAQLLAGGLCVASDTIRIPEMIVLDRAGATYDYRGATLVWTGEGDCSQKEGMPPMFAITAPGVTLKNATIIGAPDGIHIHSAGVTLENLRFPDVCEDAVTFKRGARRATVRNCHFAKAADKVIQASYGRWHRVTGCSFTDCVRPFRSGAGVTALFYNNTLRDCHSAVRASGQGSRTLMWDNRLHDVRHPTQPLGRARIVVFR